MTNPTSEDIGFDRLRESMRLSARGRTAGLIESTDGEGIILGWNNDGVASVLAEPSSADNANVANALGSGIPLRKIGPLELEVSTLNRVEPLTNNPDLPGRPAADMINIRVETAEGQRVIPVSEVDFLRGVSVASDSPFVEHHLNGASGHQITEEARRMYSFMFPQPNSDTASVVLPLSVTVPGSPAVSNEMQTNSFIAEGLKQLILNDLSSQSAVRPTYYAMALLSERGIPGGAQKELLLKIKQLEGVVKSPLVSRMVSWFVSRSEDLTRLAEFTPDIIRAKFEPIVDQAMDGLDLEALIRINEGMLKIAERVFYPDAPVETEGLTYDANVYSSSHPFLIHRETEERVPSPGFSSGKDGKPTLANGVTGDLYHPTLKPGWVCVVETRNNGGVIVPEYSVVPARGWKEVKVRGADELQLEVANGFYLGNDNRPYLLPGYIWNPDSREAEIFIK